VNQIRQEPAIDHETEAAPGEGTRVRIEWSNKTNQAETASFILEHAKARFLQVAEDFA
jgi:hypothetical protein